MTLDYAVDFQRLEPSEGNWKRFELSEGMEFELSAVENK